MASSSSADSRSTTGRFASPSPARVAWFLAAPASRPVRRSGDDSPGHQLLAERWDPRRVVLMFPVAGRAGLAASRPRARGLCPRRSPAQLPAKDRPDTRRLEHPPIRSWNTFDLVDLTKSGWLQPRKQICQNVPQPVMPVPQILPSSDLVRAMWTPPRACCPAPPPMRKRTIGSAKKTPLVNRCNRTNILSDREIASLPSLRLSSSAPADEYRLPARTLARVRSNPLRPALLDRCRRPQPRMMSAVSAETPASGVASTLENEAALRTARRHVLPCERCGGEPDDAPCRALAVAGRNHPQLSRQSPF